MIFNKNNNGTQEIQQLVGIYSQANDFHGIASEIHYAEMTVRRLIGEALYKRAEDYYASEFYAPQNRDDDTQLVRVVQAAVAQLSMYQFYQQNILSHEDGGRKVVLGADAKMPWAWQYDRDDQALLDKYYRALDELYIFVETHQITEWVEAPARKDLDDCFVKDLATFQKIFPIEDSFRMFYILVNFMLEAQENVLRPIIGNVAYVAMKSKPIPAELHEQFVAAQRCVPLYAIITAVRRMSIKVLPTMIVRRFATSFQGNGGGNIDAEAERRLLATLELEAENAKIRLQKIVTQNCSPDNEANLLPANSRHNKFCMT